MNKATKKFLFVSGLYLFLLGLILFSAPRSGISPPLLVVLVKYLLYLPLFILMYTAFYFYRKNKSLLIINNTRLFQSILISVIIGFVFNLDYKSQVGCLSFEESFLSTAKFAWSGCAILLLSAAHFSSRQKFGTVLLILEYFFWTIKSLYYNSSLDFFLPAYFTLTCWVLRICLIAKRMNKKKKI